MKLLILLTALLAIALAGLLYMRATSVVGYTQPQVEHYSDGSSDSISYPIYRAQEAK